MFNVSAFPISTAVTLLTVLLASIFFKKLTGASNPYYAAPQFFSVLSVLVFGTLITYCILLMKLEGAALQAMRDCFDESTGVFVFGVILWVGALSVFSSIELAYKNFPRKNMENLMRGGAVSVVGISIILILSTKIDVAKACLSFG